LKSAPQQHMADKSESPQPFTLKRWSQRKLAAAHAAPPEASPPKLSATENPTAASETMAAIPEVPPATIPEPAPLPPVESLDFESDYAAFMQPKVNEETKRAALKKLFSDPSFNVMDGLDIYVGDYTQSDPMPAGMLEKLSAVYAMLDPLVPSQDEPVLQGENSTVAGATPTPPAMQTEQPADVAAETSRAPQPSADAAKKTA
jgi:Protein of unknown function (DUF3306)